MNHLEDQLLRISLAFSSISQAVGKKKEIAIKRLYHENVPASDALAILLNPQIVFHLGKKSFEKDVRGKRSGKVWDDIFSLCLYLESKSGLTDADVGEIQATLDTIKATDIREFAVQFLCKTLTLGVTAKTVNKALGFEFVPEFKCMLANKYFEHPDKVEGKHFYLTEKLDGIRCIAVVKEDSVRLFSRQGVPIDGLVLIELRLKFLRQMIGKNFVFDGELLLTEREDIPSKEQYKRTTMIVRRDGIKTGITYNVFDVLDLDAFECRSCDTPYYLRRQKLDVYCSFLSDEAQNSVRPLPVLYHGSDTREIIRHLDAQRKLQHEGVMINLADETYQFTRTNALLKVKVMQDCDLEIIGFEAGNGKFEGTLGALVVNYKGTPVGVGSGLSDRDRRMFWDHQDEYLGRVATIQYFEETHSADGKPSIRFPVFKELREPGKEVSYA